MLAGGDGRAPAVRMSNRVTRAARPGVLAFGHRRGQPLQTFPGYSRANYTRNSRLTGKQGAGGGAGFVGDRIPREHAGDFVDTGRWTKRHDV